MSQRLQVEQSAQFHIASVRIPILLMASRHFGFLIAARDRAAIRSSTTPAASKIAHSMLTPVIAESHTALDCIASLSLRHCTPCFPSSAPDTPRHSATAHTHRNGTIAGTRLHSIPHLAVSRQTGYTRWRANSAPSS